MSRFSFTVLTLSKEDETKLLHADRMSRYVVAHGLAMKNHADINHDQAKKLGLPPVSRNDRILLNHWERQGIIGSMARNIGVNYRN